MSISISIWKYNLLSQPSKAENHMPDEIATPPPPLNENNNKRPKSRVQLFVRLLLIVCVYVYVYILNYTFIQVSNACNV